MLLNIKYNKWYILLEVRFKFKCVNWRYMIIIFFMDFFRSRCYKGKFEDDRCICGEL